MAGIMIAATGSGSGKTMVTCGLLALLKRKGYHPAAFKCGPDYIDGLFHRRVQGVENGNLDSFFETPAHMRRKLRRSMERHFVVAEGVMGYFDGLGGVSVRGSSFEIGRFLGLPAILVVDGRGASLSLMALIQGFLEYDAAVENDNEKKTHNKSCGDACHDMECGAETEYKMQEGNEEKYREKKTHRTDSGTGDHAGSSGCSVNHDKINNNIKGIFFNRMSPMIYNRIKPMVEERFRIPVIGYLPELEFLQVGSRHLGLVLPDEIEGIREQLEQLADRMDENLEWELLLKIAADAEGWDVSEEGNKLTSNSGLDNGDNGAETREGSETGCRMQTAPGAGPRFRLGIARDEAFCFYYGDNLEAMEEAGAQLVYFSPLHQKELPGGLDGMILGGGYPENHGGALAANRSMRDSVAAAAASGMPVLAECGGYLYLLDSLEGADGRDYPMAGVLRGHGYRAGKTGRFGYITLRPNEDLPFLPEGEEIKGHEFHYWDCRCRADEFRMMALKPNGSRCWPCMRTEGHVMAGFPHLYYPSCPELVQRFADQCVEYGKKQGKDYGKGYEL